MAKMIGLSRNLKLPWLNKATEFVREGLNEAELKEKLNDYLGYEIESPTNIRKTREILMNIWFYSNDISDKLRSTALELISAYSEYSLHIHWCMMLAAYPVFGDMCKLISKMSEFQDEITLSQLKQKLFDEWGERTTLFHSTDKIIATLKAFDVMTCDKPGKYHIKKHQTDKPEISTFMAFAALNIGSPRYTFQEINSLDLFFPFEYCIEKEMLLQDNRFMLSNISGELSISIT